MFLQALLYSNSVGTLQFGINIKTFTITANYCKDSICSQCNDDTTCIQCKENATNIGGQCTCKDGYYWDESLQSCMKCDRKCKKCQFFSDNCTECNGPNRDIEQKCACYSYFKEKQDPTSQTFSCMCDGSDNRYQKSNTECACKTNDLFQNEIAGYFQLRNEQKCEQCTKYCQVCEIFASNCIQCNQNRDKKNQCKCDCGYTEDPSDPSKCSELPNKSRQKLNEQCVCKEGFYENQQPDCSQCLPKCQTCTNGNSCQICQPGRDHKNDCQCLFGYYEPQPNSPTCQKCNFECLQCSSQADNCTQCKGDRINTPKCECPLFKYNSLGFENCQDCDITCKTCFGSNPNNCLTCMDDREYDQKTSSCLCKPGLYHLYRERKCAQCSNECATCTISKFFCTSCNYSGDILFNGTCYCGYDTSKMRQPDGSCKEPDFLTFQIYSTIDQMTYQNLVVIEFDENLTLEEINKLKLSQILNIQVDKVYRNLNQVYQEELNYHDHNLFAKFTNFQTHQRHLQHFDIQFFYDSITSNSVKFRVVSQESFSDLDLHIQLRNTEFAISKNLKRLSNQNIAKYWKISLANQYNYNNHQKSTQQQLNTMDSIHDLTFFGIFQNLYFYFVLMPGFQIMALIQILPIQLPPNLYNVCRMFNLLTFDVNFEWGLLNYYQTNPTYDKSISSQSEDDSVPQNFRRLGFSSNFFTNCLEIVVLIITIILITFALYLLQVDSQNLQSKLYPYNKYFTKAFNLSHNIISYYVEATIFFTVIGFWLNLIYLQKDAVNVVAMIFSFAVMIFIGYFLTYQACLIQLKTDMIANRHMSNFLLICFWYQKFFKLFRYSKKILILSFLVIFNFLSILQMSFITIIFIVFLVLSIFIRPYMYKIDNIFLILNDSIQAILSIFLLTITIIYEKDINSSHFISYSDIQLYLNLGWVAVSLVILFAILNTFYQLYNLLRVCDFVFKDIQQNQYLKNINENSEQSFFKRTINQDHFQGIEQIKDGVVQQGDQQYIEYLKNQQIQKILEDEKKNYYQNVTLYKRESLGNDQMKYIKAFNQSQSQNVEMSSKNQPKNTNNLNLGRYSTDISNMGQVIIAQQQQQQIIQNNNNYYQNQNNPQIKIELAINQQQNTHTAQIVNPHLQNVFLNQEMSSKDQFQTLNEDELQDYNYEPIYSQGSVQNYQMPLNNAQQQQQQQVMQNLENHSQNYQLSNQSQNINEDKPPFLQNQNQLNIPTSQTQQIFVQNKMITDEANNYQKQEHQQNLQQDLNIEYNQQFDNQDHNDQNNQQNQANHHLQNEINNNINSNENNKINSKNYRNEQQNQNTGLQYQQTINQNQLEIIQEYIDEQDSNYHSPDLFIQRVSEYKRPQN